MARKEFETLTPQMFYILLVLKKPMHGYDIMSEISRITDNRVKVGAGTLYTLLARFEKDHYIRFIKEVNRKKIYQITDLGQKKLFEEKKRMQQQIQLLEEVYCDEI